MAPAQEPGTKAVGKFNQATHDQARPQRTTPKPGLVMCGLISLLHSQWLLAQTMRKATAH